MLLRIVGDPFSLRSVTPSDDLVPQLTSLSGACSNPISHTSLSPVYLPRVFVTLLPTHLSHVAANAYRAR
jgi:hypothetical protein